MKRFWNRIEGFFSDADEPGAPGYDPVHVCAAIVLTLLGMTVLFWLFWALLVFGGGIQSKIVPGLAVLLTSRTVRDYGYIGYPYEMGVFSGWPTNIAALALLLLLCAGVGKAFSLLPPSGGERRADGNTTDTHTERGTAS